MELFKMAVLGFAFVSSGSALAANITVVKCDGAEELQIKIQQDKVNGASVALVTIQGPGDSYPTFHYKVERLVTSAVIGAPEVYSGKGFELVLDTHFGTNEKMPAKVRITDLGVNQDITCSH